MFMHIFLYKQVSVWGVESINDWVESICSDRRKETGKVRMSMIHFFPTADAIQNGRRWNPAHAPSRDVGIELKLVESSFFLEDLSRMHEKVGTKKTEFVFTSTFV
jgi:hypothetical protein